MGTHRIKSPFTLFEIGITGLLAPTLLLTLLHLCTLLITTRHRLEQALLAVHTKLLIQERLSSLHPHSLSIQNNTLHFITHDTLDPDPSYSGSLPATLSLKNNTLILTLKDRPEPLAENIRTLHIAHIAPNTPLATLRLTLTPLAKNDPPYTLAFFYNTPHLP